MRSHPNARLLERLLSALLTSIPVLGCLWFCGAFDRPSDAYAGFKASGYWSKIDTLRWDSTHTDNGKYKLISGGAVHMAVLRTNSDSTMVIHWEQNDQARLWLGASMDSIGKGYPVPNDTFNFFCGGHASLGDGKLLVVGGSVESAIGVPASSGENRNAEFDPISRSWRQVDTTHFGRWYPTVTTLADGKILATAGAQWTNMVMVGGAKDPAGVTTAYNDMRLLNLRKYENWSADPDTAVVMRPTVRSGHSAVLSDGFTVIFGGEDASGTPRNDVWALFGNNTDRARFWKWNKLSIFGDQSLSPPDTIPAARTRHTAVAFLDTMIIFGGRDATGKALDDIWRLKMDLTNSIGWWQKVNAGSPAPSGRYGHAAVLAKDDRPKPVMAVYGGQNPAGIVDSTSWELTIPRDVSGGATSFSWRRGPANTLAGKREGHTAVMLPVASGNVKRTHRMVIFGGTKDGALDNGLHELRLIEEANGTDNNWAWRGNQPTFVGNLPPARTRHGSAYDGEFNRVIVFGGDTTLSTGGHSNELWELTWRNTAVDADTAIWLPVPSDSVPDGRWGHTLTFDPRPIESHVPEVFNPTTGDKGQWSEYPSGPKYLPFYPFMFLLRDGNIFFGGNGPEYAPKESSWVYQNVGSSQASWTDKKFSQFLGGSAVYWPELNKVMKCGGDDDVTTQANQRGTASAIVTNSSATWTNHTVTGLLPESRTFHNLTALPDGRVLLTGGRTHRSGSYTQDTYMWNPADSGPKWAGPFASDPFERGYHSGALLLPDGRVLCSAGAPSLRRASAFSPPYLYAVGDTLATRPIISSYPTHTVHYGEPIFLNIGSAPIDSIKILSLIRPGAPTHGFDQNQRYIKLAYTKQNGRLRAVLPDSNFVPPGDYMLFAVRTGVGGVPSLAKWVKVSRENDQTPPEAATMDIAVSGSTAYLLWGTPGEDNGGPGAPISWEVRSSSSPINGSNWNSASAVATGTSGAIGLTDVVSFPSQVGTWYAVKTTDEQSNVSAVSNSVEDPGEGGCCLSSKRAPGAYSNQAPASLSNLGGLTMLRLGPFAEGQRSITYLNTSQTPLRVDSLTIYAASDRGDTLVYARAGQFQRGIRRPIHRITSSSAGDVTHEFAGVTGRSAAQGETLTVHRPTESSEYLWIESSPGSGGSSNATGLAVELPSGESWSRVAVRHPLNDGDGWLAPFPSDSIRLLVGGNYQIGTMVGIEPVSGTGESQALPVQLEHSRVGVLASSQDLQEPESVLMPGERLIITFADVPGESSRRLFAIIGTSSGNAAPTRSQASSGLLPLEFGLQQNEPNPFGGGTIIRFSLPVKSDLRMEVFDIHGRRIKTLTRRQWPAGYHSLPWDGRDDHNHRVRPGLYLYRMTAGSYRASRKLSILP